MAFAFRPESAELRPFLRAPIPEIEYAARLLGDAVTAHNEGKARVADELLRLANDKRVWEWTDSIWGKRSRYVQYRPMPTAPPAIPKKLRAPLRALSTAAKRQIHARDGYYCRFCGIPVIRAEVRQRFNKAYPDAVPWGRTNESQHAAFQAMWAQYDHVLPHSRGGTNDLENVILTCAACNFGRMDYTLEEVGLLGPREREPRCGPWNGLEHFTH